MAAKHWAGMMKPFIYALSFVLICIAGFSAYALFTMSDDNASENASKGAEPIRAEILNDDPSNFTIDVEFLDNADADTEAAFFAVYTSEEKPGNCADFRETELSYDKPEEHQRRFDLSEHDDIIEAIETDQCVVIPNTPS